MSDFCFTRCLADSLYIISHPIPFVKRFFKTFFKFFSKPFDSLDLSDLFIISHSKEFVKWFLKDF